MQESRMVGNGKAQTAVMESHSHGKMFLIPQAQETAMVLIDTIYPPSSLGAGEKPIKLYEYNNHQGGQLHQVREKPRFLGEHWPL